MNGLIAASVAVTIVLAFLLGTSIARTVVPSSKQGKGITGLVVGTAGLAGFAGWVLAYMGLRGNVNALYFFIFFTALVLFALNTMFGGAGSFELRKLREAMVENNIGNGALIGMIVGGGITALLPFALYWLIPKDLNTFFPLLAAIVLLIVAPVALLSATSGLFQLNGLRDAVAAKMGADTAVAQAPATA